MKDMSFQPARIAAPSRAAHAVAWIGPTAAGRPCQAGHAHLDNQPSPLLDLSSSGPAVSRKFQQWPSGFQKIPGLTLPGWVDHEQAHRAGADAGRKGSERADERNRCSGSPGERTIMRARILDLRPTKVHGQPRSTATGPVGSLPRRSRSIGKIITPWLRIMLVALGVGAVVGPLHAAAGTAAPHGKAAAGAHRQATAKPPKQPTATAAVCSRIWARDPTWMKTRPVHH